jgi:hypothetical protein
MAAPAGEMKAKAGAVMMHLKLIGLRQTQEARAEVMVTGRGRYLLLHRRYESWRIPHRLPVVRWQDVCYDPCPLGVAAAAGAGTA